MVISIYYVNNQNELYHHGVKGQRWGVRRYRNTYGSLTPAGKQHEKAGRNEQKGGRRVDPKKVALIAGALTMAAAATYVAANPKARAAVVSAAKKLGSVTSAKTKSLAAKGKHYLKQSVQEARQGLKEGIREGIHDAPKKLAKTVIGGAGLYAGKKLLDKAVGPTEAGRIFKANDKKKIGSFWTYAEKEEDDDD